LPSCSGHALGDIGAYLTPAGETAGTIPGDNGFVPGCNSGREVIDKATFCIGMGDDVPVGTYKNSACAAPAIE